MREVVPVFEVGNGFGDERWRAGAAGISVASIDGRSLGEIGGMANLRVLPYPEVSAGVNG